MDKQERQSWRWPILLAMFATFALAAYIAYGLIGKAGGGAKPEMPIEKVDTAPGPDNMIGRVPGWREVKADDNVANSPAPTPVPVPHRTE